jgi:hypothetical protein
MYDSRPVKAYDKTVPTWGMTPAPLEEAYPFADGECVAAVLARYGDAVGPTGPRSLRKAERPEYQPDMKGPKGTSRAY